MGRAGQVGKESVDYCEGISQTTEKTRYTPRRLTSSVRQSMPWKLVEVSRDTRIRKGRRPLIYGDILIGTIL